MRAGTVYDLAPRPIKMFSLPSYSEWSQLPRDEQNFAVTVTLKILPPTLDKIRAWAKETFPEESAALYAIWHELKHNELGNPFDTELTAALK